MYFAGLRICIFPKKYNDDQIDGMLQDGPHQEKQEEKRRPKRLNVQTYCSITSLKTAKDYFFKM